MKATFATLAFAGAAAAAPHVGHAQFHKKDIFADLNGLVGGAVQNMDKFMDVGASFLKTLTPMVAKNSKDTTAANFIGAATTGNYVVNTIVNKSGKDATWTCWGPEGSWINKFAPTIAVAVPKDQNVTVSHVVGANKAAENTGGCAVMFDGDKLVNGQAFQSWMEYTFVADQWASSTFDVSMEVNAKGHNMTIENEKCKSSHDTCIFKCRDPNAVQCGEAGQYELVNCKGPNTKYYEFAGVPEGGCGGIANTGLTKMTTTLHKM